MAREARLTGELFARTPEPRETVSKADALALGVAGPDDMHSE